MKKVNRSVLVGFSDQQMFDLINDVKAYPEFLNWCIGTTVYEQDPHYMRAELRLKALGKSLAFTTVNQLQSPSQIDLTLDEGVLKSLEGRWVFTPLDTQACRVEFNISFAVAGLLMLPLEPLLEKIMDSLVDQFVARAKCIYR